MLYTLYGLSMCTPLQYVYLLQSIYPLVSSFVFNSFPCVSIFPVFPLCLYLPFVYLKGVVVGFHPISPSLSFIPPFCVSKKGSSGCPPYHSISPSLSIFFSYLYLVFICMLFYIYLCTPCPIHFPMVIVCTSMFTLFLCLPHLFLLSSKRNNWLGFFLNFLVYS